MKQNKDGFPIAECYRDGVYWVVPRCPLCNGRHLHGAGAGGHRVGHCPPGTPGADLGYVLVQAGPSGPAGPSRG